MKFAHDIILRPIITEASLEATKKLRYTFEVLPDATKSEIASAVEEVFGVKVADVNTISMPQPASPQIKKFLHFILYSFGI